MLCFTTLYQRIIRSTEMIISINVLRFLDRLIVLHFSNYNERTQISNSLFRDNDFHNKLIDWWTEIEKFEQFGNPSIWLWHSFCAKFMKELLCDYIFLIWILFCLVSIFWSEKPLIVSKMSYLYGNFMCDIIDRNYEGIT